MTGLERVAEARVPLEGAEDARLVAFRPGDGGTEHLAILIGTPTRRRAGAGAAAFRMLYRRRAGEPALRLRRAAARRDRDDRRGRRRRAALPRAGRPRHRPRQQAARLSAAGCRVRHDRRQRAARLRRRRARLSAGGRNAAPARLHRGAPVDQQPRQGRRARNATASPSSSGCRTSSPPTATTSATCAPRPPAAGISSKARYPSAARYGRRAPKIAVPTRTWVAPKRIAVS